MTHEIDPSILTIMAEFTPKQVGEQIRTARQQAGMSQTHLAEILSRRQAYISDMENGKAEPSATMLVQLAYALKKPVSFFFPPEYRNFEQGWTTKKEELSVEEQELITKLRSIRYFFEPKLALHLVNALADYSTRMFEAFESDIPSDDDIEYQEYLEAMVEMDTATRQQFEEWQAFRRQHEEPDED